MPRYDIPAYIAMLGYSAFVIPRSIKGAFSATSQAGKLLHGVSVSQAGLIAM